MLALSPLQYDELAALLNETLGAALSGQAIAESAHPTFLLFGARHPDYEREEDEGLDDRQALILVAVPEPESVRVRSLATAPQLLALGRRRVDEANTEIARLLERWQQAQRPGRRARLSPLAARTT